MAMGPAVARSRPRVPWRSSAVATPGSYAVRRIRASSLGVSQSPGGEVCGAQGCGEGRHLLAENGCAAADAVARGSDGSAGGLHVEGDGDRGGAAFTGGSCLVDEFGVGLGGPGVVVGAVVVPPVGQPRPESGSVRSSTWREAMRPERQVVVASTRPQPVTRRCCSAGSRRVNAGWVTPMIAVSVAAWGSWIMTAPVLFVVPLA